MRGLQKRAKKTGHRHGKKMNSDSASGNVFRLELSRHAQVGQVLVLQMSTMALTSPYKDNICVVSVKLNLSLSVCLLAQVRDV